MKNKGMTLFIAVVVMSILLFISFAVINIAIKGTLFAGSGRDSQYAFYAADAGVECAFYWDSKSDSFATSTANTINCVPGTNISTGSQSVPTNPAQSSAIGTGGAEVLNQTVAENGTAAITCPSGVITSYISTYGENTSGGNCPVSCGTCTLGNNSCSVTYNNSNCGDCYPGYPKYGSLTVACSNTGSTASSIFYFDMNQGLNPTNSCSIVSVSKYYKDENLDGIQETLKTYIKSRGYNTCDTSNIRRVERGIEVTY